MIKKFPTFAVILLVIGLIWFASELGLMVIKVPWIPLIIIIIALGMIINRKR